MNRRTRVLGALYRHVPRPEPPDERFLQVLRRERADPLARLLLGVSPRRVVVSAGTVPGADGVELATRTYRPRHRPNGLRQLLVSFPGGGFVVGSLRQADWLNGRLADQLDAVVVSVRYRLAPEHPAPVPYADCWAATRWLIGHADELGADPARVSLVGASAGGTLAALVALAHRDLVRDAGDAGVDGEVAPLLHQVLVYPATDLTLASPSVAEHTDAPILSRQVLDWYGRRYLPQDGPDSISYDDPRVSPLFAPDHTDVAPALLIAAGHDPLRDDAVRYHEVLTKAGVHSRLVVYPDAVHGFASIPLLDPAAVLALTEIVTELSPGSGSAAQAS